MDNRKGTGMQDYTSCTGCGIDVETDQEIMQYRAVALDPNGIIRAMVVNVKRSESCRHSYWTPTTFGTESEASAWMERVNA